MDTTDKLIAERGKTHGDYTKTARVIQGIKRVIQNELEGTLRDYQQEALDMIAHKIGRIVSGDPDFREHWIDISGYAQLVSDRLAQPPAVTRSAPGIITFGTSTADITDVD